MEYGPILKEQGFIEVAQLTLEWTTPSLLKDLLSIPIGTAILIKQYAKEDLEAVQQVSRG